VTEPVVRRLPEAPDLPHPLGRHVQHDPRSRSFAFTAPEPLPLQDVAWRRRVPAYDQGQLGSCTANALCGALSTLPHRHRFRSQRNIVGVYSAATQIDPFDGAYPPEDTGSSGLAVAKVALSRGWISQYRHIFRFEDLLQALMVGALIEGTIWGHDGFHPEPDGRVHFTGGIAGGHEYETFGVDVERRRLWHWNSWGSNWGAGPQVPPAGQIRGSAGAFYTTWQDTEDALAQDGDATVLVP
jgi:hypothetical protein